MVKLLMEKKPYGVRGNITAKEVALSLRPAMHWKVRMLSGQSIFEPQK
jgi:hypothetical protein